MLNYRSVVLERKFSGPSGLLKNVSGGQGGKLSISQNAHVVRAIQLRGAAYIQHHSKVLFAGRNSRAEFITWRQRPLLQSIGSSQAARMNAYFSMNDLMAKETGSST